MESHEMILRLKPSIDLALEEQKGCPAKQKL